MIVIVVVVLVVVVSPEEYTCLVFKVRIFLTRLLCYTSQGSSGVYVRHTTTSLWLFRLQWVLKCLHEKHIGKSVIQVCVCVLLFFYTCFKVYQELSGKKLQSLSSLGFEVVIVEGVLVVKELDCW